MSQSRIPSPARSQGALTPRRHKPKRTRSVGSPARSTASGRLTAVIQFKENNRDSFALSPAPSRRSVLNDDTYVDEPRRRSWWKKLGENSRDVMEVLNDNKILETNEAVEEYIDIEVLSQEKKNYTIDLPDSSDSESISSIVIPQRKLFTQKDLQAQNKFGKLVGTRETLTKLHKSNVADKSLKVAPKNLFNQNNRPRTKPVFPAALLNVSPNKTANKTKEMVAEVKGEVRNLFVNRGGAKRKNMFADFIVSESEDEIPDIQPKVFGFQKQVNNRRDSSTSRGKREHSPTSSITTDVEMDEWQHLPSSTMVDNQLEDMMAVGTPVKRPRLSNLAEIKECEAGKEAEYEKESDEEQKLIYEDDVQSDQNSKESQEVEENQDDIKEACGEQPKNNIGIEGDNNDGNSNRQEHVEDENLEEMEVPIIAIAQKSMYKSQIQNKEDELLKNESHSPDKAIKDNNEREFLDEHNMMEIQEKSQVQNEKDKLSESKAHSEKSKDENIQTETCETDYKEKSDSNIQLADDGNQEESEDEIVMDAQESAEKSQVLDEDEEDQGDNEQEDEVQDESEVEGKNESETEPQNENEIIEPNEKREKSQIQNEDEQIVNDEEEMEVDVQKENDEIEVEAQNKSQVKAVNDNEAEVENENEIEARNEIELEGENESEVEGENENEIEAGNEIELEDENESVVEGENEIEIEAGSEVELECQNESEVEAENESEVEHESEIEAPNEFEVEADNQSEIEQPSEELEESAINEHDQDEDDDQDDNDEEVEENETENEEAINESEVEAEQESAVEAESEIENESEVENQNETEEETENEALQYESDAEDMQVDTHVDQESENEIQDSNEHDDVQHTDEQDTPNITHDTTGRNRRKNETRVNSPEAILHDKTNQIESFMAQGRNTSARKTTIPKNLNIRPSLAPPRESTGISDGTRNSSAEGSGWDSHRTTRKTLRQTLGKDFTPRKSLRALVMEKSAKRQTVNDLASVTSKFPQANSTEFPEADSTEIPEASMAADDYEIPEENHDISKRTRQTTLEMYLQKIKKQNYEKKLKLEEAVRNSLKAPTRDILNPFKVPSKPMFPLKKSSLKPAKSKPSKKHPKSTLIPLDDLPDEVIEDMKYKPPKRFQPSNASWITKRLYKFLESKLESKYDYKARIRAEKLVQSIYHFAKDLRRHDVAPDDAVDVLKHEMARLDVVKTHFDFYQFFHEYMPREIRVKVVPDVVNKIGMPRHGVFSQILQGNAVQG